jgi:BlaI family transcriptional regulator, penicillinase repressor
MIKELTKAEEQVMQVLWEIKEGFVKDILENFPTPNLPTPLFLQL